MPVGKSNAARPTLPGIGGAALAPSQTSRDHQVEDDEEIAVEREHDALAEAPEADDAASLELTRRGRDGAHQKRVADPKAFERLTEDAGVQRFEIDRDVRELGHVVLSRRLCAQDSHLHQQSREVQDPPLVDDELRSPGDR